MQQIPDRPPSGPVPGALLGIAAGLLVGWTWMFGGEDVALALTAVVIGLVAVLVGATSGWGRFGVAFLVLAVLACGGLVVLVWSARR